LIVLAPFVIGYVVLMARPHLLFPYQARAGNVVLHMRVPATSPARAIAAAAQQRVSRSPLYRAQDTYDVFLCDTPALFAFFAPVNRNVGGIADVYLTRYVFLRPSRLDRDRLVGPSGVEAAGDRTLTYFIAHEITHIITARHLGSWRYIGLVVWQREGYADYVGKGSRFDFAAALRDFRAGTKDFDPRRSGLYLRYHLLVAELLDRRGMSVQELLSHGMPAAPIEGALLAR